MQHGSVKISCLLNLFFKDPQSFSFQNEIKYQFKGKINEIDNQTNES